MELEELKKLKVQDLKNELAKYQLSQVGKKDEVNTLNLVLKESRV